MNCLPTLSGPKLHFSSSTGLSYSTVHHQYLTWNEQVECDESSLFFSASVWTLSAVFGSFPRDLDCTGMKLYGTNILN